MPICPAVGTIREYPIELVDTRPDLTVRIGLGAPTLSGGVYSAGSIHATAFGTCHPFVCGFDPLYGISGRVDRLESDARYGIDARINRGEPCFLTEHVTGVRR